MHYDATDLWQYNADYEDEQTVYFTAMQSHDRFVVLLKWVVTPRAKLIATLPSAWFLNSAKGLGFKGEFISLWHISHLCVFRGSKCHANFKFVTSIVAIWDARSRSDLIRCAGRPNHRHILLRPLFVPKAFILAGVCTGLGVANQFVPASFGVARKGYLPPYGLSSPTCFSLGCWCCLLSLSLFFLLTPTGCGRWLSSPSLVLPEVGFF